MAKRKARGEAAVPRHKGVKEAAPRVAMDEVGAEVEEEKGREAPAAADDSDEALKAELGEEDEENVADVEDDDMYEEDSDGSGGEREGEGGEDDDDEEEEDEDKEDQQEESGDDGEGDDDSDGDVRDFRKKLLKKTKRSDSADAAPEASPAGTAAGPAQGAAFVSDGLYRNKQRVLLFSSRGITSRYRHLMEDLRKMIPHHKKDTKLDVGRGESLAGAVNEIAELKSCNSCLFLECRKRQDLYLWAGKTPNGPSVKFLVLNVHTMDELKLTGNCMLGSRPLLSFDSKFDEVPQWRLIKAIFTDIFGTPRGHPKSKPFVDRVMSFFVADGKCWVRNYQVMDKGDGGGPLLKKLERTGEEPLSLVEIGPRFVLSPVRVFAGSLGGPTLYQNPAYVSPNAARAARKRAAGARYSDRTAAKAVNRGKKAVAAVEPDELADVFRG